MLAADQIRRPTAAKLPAAVHNNAAVAAPGWSPYKQRVDQDAAVRQLLKIVSFDHYSFACASKGGAPSATAHAHALCEDSCPPGTPPGQPAAQGQPATTLHACPAAEAAAEAVDAALSLLGAAREASTAPPPVASTGSPEQDGGASSSLRLLSPLEQQQQQPRQYGSGAAYHKCRCHNPLSEERADAARPADQHAPPRNARRHARRRQQQHKQQEQQQHEQSQAQQQDPQQQQWPQQQSVGQRMSDGSAAWRRGTSQLAAAAAAEASTAVSEPQRAVRALPAPARIASDVAAAAATRVLLLSLPFLLKAYKGAAGTDSSSSSSSSSTARTAADQMAAAAPAPAGHHPRLQRTSARMPAAMPRGLGRASLRLSTLRLCAVSRLLELSRGSSAARADTAHLRELAVVAMGACRGSGAAGASSSADLQVPGAQVEQLPLSALLREPGLGAWLQHLRHAAAQGSLSAGVALRRLVAVQHVAALPAAQSALAAELGAEEQARLQRQLRDARALLMEAASKGAGGRVAMSNG